RPASAWALARRSAMNEFRREQVVTESEETFGRGGKPVRVERFDPGPGRAAAAVLLLHGADGLRYRGPTYRDMARDLARDGYLTLLVHYFASTGIAADRPLTSWRAAEAVET